MALKTSSLRIGKQSFSLGLFALLLLFVSIMMVGSRVASADADLNSQSNLTRLAQLTQPQGVDAVWQPTKPWQPQPTKAWQPQPTKAWQPQPTKAWQPQPTKPSVPGNYTPPANEVAPPPPAPGAPATNSTVIQITNEIQLAGAQRFGINVGARDQYGAGQLLKNLVPNPGFESAEFAMVIHILPGASGNRIQSDNWETNWNNDTMGFGQLPGFWNGSQYEIVTGAAKGRSGTVSSFTHENGRYTFNLDGQGAAPAQDNIMIVRKTDVPGYNLDRSPSAVGVTGNVRPGSPGKQSLRLAPMSGGQNSWSKSFDSFARDSGDSSAGKLLQVRGPWHFEIWASAVNPGAKLSVTFRRLGEKTFFTEEIPLQTGWQQITRDFTVTNEDDPQIAGVPQPLELSFHVTGEVLVDDVVLRRADYTNPTVFSDKYVQLLRDLRPGVLRDWGEQSGSSLNNQLSSEFARKPTGSSPKHRVAPNWHYSLHEFLVLAKTVGADPWYVIPSTWSNADIQNLIAYLAAPAGSHPYANMRAALGQQAPWTSVFGQIHLELGNETWGFNYGSDPFIGQSFRGGERAGQVISARYAALKTSPYYNKGKFDLEISGQARFPGRQTEIEANSTEHNTIGFAPYYGELQVRNTDADRYNPLFASPEDSVQRGFMFENKNILDQAGNGTKMSIYEINVHTLRNAVPSAERNEFVAGQGAGLSLPLMMLTYQRDMGIRTQVGFQSLQFSVNATGGNARLFGMLRDLEATGRKRPTWLGLEAANKAIKGDLMKVNVTGVPSYNQSPINGIVGQTQTEYVQAFAFKQGGQYGLVLFNVDINRAHAVTLQLPSAPQGQAQLYTFSSADIDANNEDKMNVGIFQSSMALSKNQSMTLGAHSMYVLTWSGQ